MFRRERRGPSPFDIQHPFPLPLFAPGVFNPSMPTRTGALSIGFRQGWQSWQKDLDSLLAWAVKSGFEAIDLTNATPACATKVLAAGLKLGSVDLLDFPKLMAKDPGRRQELVGKNIEHIKAMTAAGAKTFFTCMLPEDPAAKRSENYKLAVETFAPLCATAQAAGAKIAVEGYPGGPPHYGAIGCTPESVRALARDLPGGNGQGGFALNYDPSHLLRLGICPLRFAKEFAHLVAHAHAKDTEILSDNVYEFGLYQSATFADAVPFGEHVWRYTIPGRGQVPWSRCLKTLSDSGYTGPVCIELEDAHFNGSESTEKEGLLYAQNFLRSA